MNFIDQFNQSSLWIFFTVSSAVVIIAIFGPILFVWQNQCVWHVHSIWYYSYGDAFSCQTNINLCLIWLTLCIFLFVYFLSRYAHSWNIWYAMFVSATITVLIFFSRIRTDAKWHVGSGFELDYLDAYKINLVSGRRINRLWISVACQVRFYFLLKIYCHNSARTYQRVEFPLELVHTLQ